MNCIWLTTGADFCPCCLSQLLLSPLVVFIIICLLLLTCSSSSSSSSSFSSSSYSFHFLFLLCFLRSHLLFFLFFSNTFAIILLLHLFIYLQPPFALLSALSDVVDTATVTIFCCGSLFSSLSLLLLLHVVATYVPKCPPLPMPNLEYLEISGLASNINQPSTDESPNPPWHILAHACQRQFRRRTCKVRLWQVTAFCQHRHRAGYTQLSRLKPSHVLNASSPPPIVLSPWSCQCGSRFGLFLLAAFWLGFFGGKESWKWKPSCSIQKEESN